MRTLFPLFIGIVMLLPAPVWGQESDCLGLDPRAWNYPENAALAKEKNAYYSDLLSNEEYAEALVHLWWLFENAADMNPGIYINGAKIYENMANGTDDLELKYAYYDSALWCYDQRIHFWCDEDGKVRDYRALYLFKFYYRDGTQYPRILENYKNLYAERGNAMGAINAVPYMTTVARMYDPMNVLAFDDVLEVYDQLYELIDYQVGAGIISAEKGEEYQNQLDQKITFEGTPIDQEFIEENFCSKFAQDGPTLNLAKKIVAYSLSNQATDNSCFADAARMVYDSDPTGALARLIGDQKLAAEAYGEAIVWYEKAIGHSDDPQQKSELYYKIAVAHRTQGQYTSARSAALQGIDQDPNYKNNYIMIGDLYQSSFQQCKGGENVVHDRAIYIAAYNWYRKAGDSSRMAAARAQFPSTEDIFTYNMREGQTYTVGCWINETVTIQARP